MKKQGIYFIYDINNLVYIGKTTNLDKRFKNHSSVKDGRTYKFLPISNKSDMALLELAYIDKYKPEENSLDKFNSTSSIAISLPGISNLSTKQFYIAKTGGMRLIKTHDLFEILPQIVNSSKDMEIVSYILKHNSSKGVVKEIATSKAISVNSLAKLFEVSRKKISEVITRCEDIGLIKRNKRTLVVNPHIVTPHRISNKSLHILQVYWDSDFTYDITNELAEAELEYAQYKASNTPEEV